MTDKRMQIFGEVLFDHFPDGSCVLGGAPFNVAWHLQAFKQQPCFISRIGTDAEGENVATAMAGWGMDMAGLQRDAQHRTGAVQVKIANNEPSYTIVPDQAYDFISAEDLPDGQGGGLLYHGTLALRQETSSRALQALKSRHRGPVFLDVNLRAPWWDKSRVLEGMMQADWVKLNHEELQALQLAAGEDDLQSMRQVVRHYGLQGLVLTRGSRGAVALDAGGSLAEVAPTAAVEVVDTVGAGDAFAAVLMLGIQSSWPLPLILQRAQDFASALVGCRGATVADKAFYQTFVDQWALV